MTHKITKLTIAAVSMVVLSFQSCSKIASKFISPVDVELATDIVLPATSDTTSQAQIGQQSFSYNIDDTIKAKTGGAASFSTIKGITISKVEMTLNNADAENNFGNFIVAAASFNTSANNNSYEPFTIADVENNPSSYSTDLEPSVVDATTDVKKYFSDNTTVYYIVSAKLRHKTTKDLQCHVTVTFHLTF